MKSKSFLMLLICMISFTVMAATPLPEQKPEATLVYLNEYTQEVEKVASLEYVLTETSIYEKSNDAQIFSKTTGKNQNYFTIVDDVGWSFKNLLLGEDVNSLVITLTTRSAGVSETERGSVRILCLQSATLPNYPNNVYWYACSVYGGVTYFTDLTYTNGELTHSATSVVKNCSCNFD